MMLPYRQPNPLEQCPRGKESIVMQVVNASCKRRRWKLNKKHRNEVVGG
jgi:hypothetical protein